MKINVAFFWVFCIFRLSHGTSGTDTMTTQKTITIKGKKITAATLRRTRTAENNAGHDISTPHGLEIHWVEIDGEIGIFNAGSVHRDCAFGSKAAFIA